MTFADACSTGTCVDPDCILHGCKQKRRSGIDLYGLPQQPQGCICPPTSEQTCMNPRCPRRPPPQITAKATP